MGISAFSIFSSTFGFIVAAISLFAFLTNICRSYLPSNRINELESLMDETEAFFQKALEDGLLLEPVFVQQAYRHLRTLRRKTHRLQSRTYNATTLRQDYLEFLKGTSKSIAGTCRSLKKLKAEVIISSEKARNRPMERNLVPHCTPSPAPPPTANPSSVPCIQAPRPVHVSQNSRDGDSAVPNGFVQGNPVRNPTRGDSDVRITDAQCRPSIIHTSVTSSAGPEYRQSADSR